MTFLRNLGHDLVDKRLWPLALMLVIALVAIPVVLGRSSAPAEPAPATPVDPAVAAVGAGAAGSVLPAQAVVSLDQPLTGGPRYRRGPVRNPFVQQHLPKVDAIGSTLVASAAATTASDSVASTAATDGSASFTSPGSSAPASDPFGGSPSDDPASSPAPPSGSPSPSPSPTSPGKQPSSGSGPDTNDIYRVSLRFGEAGNQRTIKNISRLTPLPSSSDPFFVFLGVLRDGKTAVFLVSSDATATGDGTCKPRANACETIELKAGETEFFDLSTGTAGVIQYQLDLLSVGKRNAATSTAAAKSRARESKAGRDILRAAVKQTDLGFDYIPRLGVLTPAKHDNVKDDGRGYVPASVLQGSLPGIDPVSEEPVEGGSSAAEGPALSDEVDASGYLPAQPVPDPPPPPAGP